MLDKTGTVTTGHMTLTGVIPAAGEDEGLVLWLAVALEDSSEHRFAQAIATAATERQGGTAVVVAWDGSARGVLVVADGVNDAAALAQADLGLAMGTGTDVAIEASDLTLVRGDLRVVADAIRLARRTLTIIKGKPFLGLRLERRRAAPSGRRHAEPSPGQGRDGVLLGVRVSNSRRLRRFRAANGPS